MFTQIDLNVKNNTNNLNLNCEISVIYQYSIDFFYALKNFFSLYFLILSHLSNIINILFY